MHAMAPDLPTTPKIFSRLFLDESSGRFSAMIMRDCMHHQETVLLFGF